MDRAARSPAAAPAAPPAVQRTSPAPGVDGSGATVLPPLPIGVPPQRPIEVVRAVYAFAARHPEVLDYVPCFCGCEHNGHARNTDCFVARRDAGGRVTWDPHGMG
jgi:hypothetical protein